MYKTAILILHFGGFSVTKSCIDSILLNVRLQNRNIFIVDNNETNSNEQDFLNNFPDIKYLKPKHNYGFAAGVNFGLNEILSSEFDAVLIINNDTIVAKHFLDSLESTLFSSEKIGICVPKILMYYYPNKLYHAGGGFKPLIGRAYMFGFMQNDGPQFSSQKPVTFANGCCMLVKTAIFREIGLLDENYYFYGEDAEFSKRIVQYGFNIIFCPSSVIYHKVDLTKNIRESSHYLFHFYRSLRLLYGSEKRFLQNIIQFLYYSIYIPYSILKRFKRKNIPGGIAIFKGFFSKNYKFKL